jgi:hypothetical protein
MKAVLQQGSLCWTLRCCQSQAKGCCHRNYRAALAATQQQQQQRHGVQQVVSWQQHGQYCKRSSSAEAPGDVKSWV